MKKNIYYIIAIVITLIVGGGFLYHTHTLDIQANPYKFLTDVKPAYASKSDIKYAKKYGAYRYNDTVLHKHGVYNYYVIGDLDFNKAVYKAVNAWSDKANISFNLASNIDKAQIIIFSKNMKGKYNISETVPTDVSSSAVVRTAVINVNQDEVKKEKDNLVKIIESQIGSALGLDMKKHDKHSIMSQDVDETNHNTITDENASEVNDNWNAVYNAQ